MYTLLLSKKFDESFSRIKDTVVQKQIWKKIGELEERAPVGKKLRGNPFWSIHINRFRIIYQMEGSEILILDVLERKHDYRELG